MNASLPGGALSAEATARLVLGWAGNPDTTPPTGQLRGTPALARPSRSTRLLLRSLAGSTAARLGAGAPPFGDPERIGLGALLLAAAIGGRAQPLEAVLLAEALPAARLGADESAGWADALARHAVVGPFVEHPAAAVPPPGSATDPSAGAVPEPAPHTDPAPAEPLRETLLRAAPLTAVLHRPPAERLTGGGAPGAEVAAAMALLTRPRGGRVLVGALAGCSPDPLVLTWRTQLLRILATTGDRPDLVADTYLAARVRHGAAWDAALRAARAGLRSLDKAPDATALAVAKYWLPLADLWSTPYVKQRPRLLAEARPALDLVVARHKWLIEVMAA